jgi:hypothetical protein
MSENLGTIIKTDGIDMERWHEMIGTHLSLAHPPARPGINPFTKQEMVYKPNKYFAQVVLDKGEIGAIYPAMDGSPYLIVDAEESCDKGVREVAEDIARILGGRFELDTNEK